MIRRIVLLVGSLLLAFAVLAVVIPSRHGAEPASTPSRSLRFTSVVHVPALPSGSHELRLWIPLPYENRYQSISHLRIESPLAYRAEEEPEYRNHYAYIAIPAARAAKPFDIRLTFDVTRIEHRVALSPSPHATAAPALVTAHYLQPDRLIPINGEIGDLSRREAGSSGTPLAKARRLYDYVVATMHYDHDGTGWGRGDALWACNAKHGNCTDFHSLFIGMARAAGIPARFEIGFPLPEDAHEGAITSYHCWAEFYVKGIGWIPLDASEAWKHPEKKDYFFGATDQNRVMFSLGRDIRLRPAQRGEPLNYFVYPYAELDGKPFAAIKSDYAFQDQPPAAAPQRAAAPAGN